MGGPLYPFVGSRKRAGIPLQLFDGGRKRVGSFRQPLVGSWKRAGRPLYPFVGGRKRVGGPFQRRVGSFRGSWPPHHRLDPSLERLSPYPIDGTQDDPVEPWRFRLGLDLDPDDRIIRGPYAVALGLEGEGAGAQGFERGFQGAHG